MTLSLDVTRRRLMLLGSRDSVTGWYDVDYEESDAEMIIIPRAAVKLALAAGVYVRNDAVGLTQDPMLEWDEIKTDTGVYYQVQGVQEHWLANSFMYRECDLSSLPLHGLTYTNTTPTVEDARYRTKVYWDTYLDSSNLNDHSHIVCYANPDYPIAKVYKTKGIHIIFAVDQPSSTPMMQHDHTPYGYEEHVPTHVLTLDTELQWLAEAEMRRIVETYPQGSQRSLERRSSRTIQLGSTPLYDTEFILSYRRDTT